MHAKMHGLQLAVGVGASVAVHDCCMYVSNNVIGCSHVIFLK